MFEHKYISYTVFKILGTHKMSIAVLLTSVGFSLFVEVKWEVVFGI